MVNIPASSYLKNVKKVSDNLSEKDSETLFKNIRSILKEIAGNSIGANYIIGEIDEVFNYSLK